MKSRRAGARWYCLACAPQRELAAKRALARAGVEAMVLTEVRWRRQRGRGGARRLSEHPVMPGYLLVPGRHAADAWSAVRLHPYLRKVVGDRPISDAELARLEAIMGREVIRLDQHAAPLAIGQDVLVTRGPWAWTRARLHSIWADQAALTLPALGSTRPVWVPLANLSAA